MERSASPRGSGAVRDQDVLRLEVCQHAPVFNCLVPEGLKGHNSRPTEDDSRCERREQDIGEGDERVPYSGLRYVARGTPSVRAAVYEARSVGTACVVRVGLLLRGRGQSPFDAVSPPAMQALPGRAVRNRPVAGFT